MPGAFYSCTARYHAVRRFSSVYCVLGSLTDTPE